MIQGEYIAEWCRYTLDFKFEARTSRTSMMHKDTYLIKLTSPDKRISYGEVPLFKGLSAEDTPAFESLLSEACSNPLCTLEEPPCSSIAFGFESAFANLENEERTPWQNGEYGIPINGLIWMGDKELMQRRIAEKLNDGFRILKLKIGGIRFDDEIDLLKIIRKSFSKSDLEIRLDANGSFTQANALDRLNILSAFNIHSLEQPIKAGQTETMADICLKSPVAIALDEELIGKRTHDEKVALLNAIKPQYIILKPALCGGFRDAADYAAIIGEDRWWATSALESNLGLYAIGRWLSHYNLSMPQGLGTGLLYSNNIPSPLEMHNAALWCNNDRTWRIPDNLPWQV